ncbi:MAG: hypothetical protein FJ135_14430 [Deltaproteobacteria bacterium]|nr:hypothetical protein [Deltaproteobacteria bacterium]
MKKIFGFFDRDPEKLKGKVFIHFIEDDQVVPRMEWHAGHITDGDWISFIIFYYARIMFELAELNEMRVARELMDFVTRVGRRLANPARNAGKFKIPLGKLRYGQEVLQPSSRVYRAALYAKKSGSCRLDFTGVIGKEKFYLPASFLILLQHGIMHTGEESQERLGEALFRLNHYYRYKRDFWDSASLTEGPNFALGTERLGEPIPEL